MQFSKDTWKSITDTIGKAVHLETVAITKSQLTFEVLQDLEQALTT